jgi:hypothetical protein
VRDADRSIWAERGLEAHARRGFVALDADNVEDVDRGAALAEARHHGEISAANNAAMNRGCNLSSSVAWEVPRCRW